MREAGENARSLGPARNSTSLRSGSDRRAARGWERRSSSPLIPFPRPRALLASAQRGARCVGGAAWCQIGARREHLRRRGRGLGGSMEKLGCVGRLGEDTRCGARPRWFHGRAGRGASLRLSAPPCDLRRRRESAGEPVHAPRVSCSCWDAPPRSHGGCRTGWGLLPHVRHSSRRVLTTACVLRDTALSALAAPRELAGQRQGRGGARARAGAQRTNVDVSSRRPGSAAAGRVARTRRRRTRRDVVVMLCTQGGRACCGRYALLWES